MKDVDRQAARNSSPTGVKDRPGTRENPVYRMSLDDKMKLSKEGRLRRHGEGVEEAERMFLHIKSKAAKGGNGARKKLSEVYANPSLLYPLSPLFHSFSNLLIYRSIYLPVYLSVYLLSSSPP